MYDRNVFWKAIRDLCESVHKLSTVQTGRWKRDDTWVDSSGSFDALALGSASSLRALEGDVRVTLAREIGASPVRLFGGSVLVEAPNFSEGPAPALADGEGPAPVLDLAEGLPVEQAPLCAVGGEIVAELTERSRARGGVGKVSLEAAAARHSVSTAGID